MNAYLTKHKYGNTFTEDLWDALEGATGKPIRMVMSTWTRQMGYPVIKVLQFKKIVLDSRKAKIYPGRFNDGNSYLVNLTELPCISPAFPALVVNKESNVNEFLKSEVDLINRVTLVYLFS